jgi:hypothetical protein
MGYVNQTINNILRKTTLVIKKQPMSAANFIDFHIGTTVNQLIFAAIMIRVFLLQDSFAEI